MPRGTPDDRVQSLQTAAVLTDPAEVAARQVGVSLADSLGRTILYDDFRSGLTRPKRVLQGTVTVFPVLASVITEYTSASVIVGAGFVGPYGVRFPLITTTANTDKASLVYDVMLGTSKRLGLEVGVWLDSALTNDFEVAIIYQRTGGSEYTAILYYDAANQQFKLGSASGTVIATVSNVVGWVQLKLVADFETGTYSRIIIGESRYDQTASLTASAVVPEGEVNFGLTAIGRAPAASRPVVVGYILLTRDEP